MLRESERREREKWEREKETIIRNHRIEIETTIERVKKECSDTCGPEKEKLRRRIKELEDLLKKFGAMKEVIKETVDSVDERNREYIDEDGFEAADDVEEVKFTHKKVTEER